MIVWLARPLTRCEYLNDRYFTNPHKAMDAIDEEFGPGISWYMANPMAWVGMKPTPSEATVEEMDDNEYVVWGYEVE